MLLRFSSFPLVGSGVPVNISAGNKPVIAVVVRTPTVVPP